jgi:cell division protein FtsL
MDIQVGKNKYKVTLTLIIAVGAILASAISWFTMIQVNMATMQEEINSLGKIIETQESRVQACLDVVDDYNELLKRVNP